MQISGYTFVKNATRQSYPFKASIKLIRPENKVASSAKGNPLHVIPLVIFFLLCISTKASSQELDLKYRRFRVSPLPVVYYTPETRIGFGGLLAVSFDTQKIPDSTTRTSYSQTYLLFTQNKQHDLGHMTRIYLSENKWVMQANINFVFFPEYYYGISTEDPLSRKDTIEYNRTTIAFRGYNQISKNIYAGLSFRYQNIRNVFSEPGGSFNEDLPVGYNGYNAIGFAPSFAFESRDSQVYPRNGWFIEVQYFLYPNFGDSYNSFTSFRADVRKYYPLEWISKRDVLAVQFLALTTGGDVPFKELAELGGSNTMRGYYTGFYRYRNLYAAQIEFRSAIWKFIGFDVWLGAALTTDTWYDFFENPVKPNAGVGLRIMINRKDKLNIRIDQGFGKERQRGFYMDIGEAY